MKSWKTHAVILKRSKSGDGDLVITLYSEEKGKIVVYAKGARKLLSKKGSGLEPGNMIFAQIYNSRSLPFLQETRVIHEFSRVVTDLKTAKQLFQVLEMVDVLTVEDDPSQAVFGLLHRLLGQLQSHAHRGEIQKSMVEVLTELGYQPEDQSKSITENIQRITEKPLKSYAFLTVYNKKQ